MLVLFGVRGMGSGVENLVFRVWGSGFEDLDLGFVVENLRIELADLGSRI